MTYMNFTLEIWRGLDSNMAHIDSHSKITVRSKELLWPAQIGLSSVLILFQLIHILNIVATILVVE